LVDPEVERAGDGDVHHVVDGVVVGGAVAVVVEPVAALGARRLPRRADLADDVLLGGIGRIAGERAGALADAEATVVAQGVPTC
jgi:hypothetical protein